MDLEKQIQKREVDMKETEKAGCEWLPHLLPPWLQKFCWKSHGCWAPSLGANSHQPWAPHSVQFCSAKDGESVKLPYDPMDHVWLCYRHTANSSKIIVAGSPSTPVFRCFHRIPSFWFGGSEETSSFMYAYIETRSKLSDLLLAFCSCSI